MTTHEPYAFVPHPKHTTPQRKAPLGHDTLQGASGELWCELEALSPLLVMGSEHRAGSNRHEVGRFDETTDFRAIIPGTSLKGMVRSVFEVLVPSCVALQGRNTGHLVPRSFYNCSKRDQLCPACRAFGALTNPPHKGCIHIGQAEAVDAVNAMPDVQLVPLFGPNPKFRDGVNPMYGTDAKSGGRKFYFHQAQLVTAEDENDREYGPYVAPFPGRGDNGEQGATFSFKVTYENLEPAALKGLVASLVLADAAPLGGRTVKVRHKLGYGKPVGLGSAEIRITRAVQYSGARYESFSGGKEVLEGEALDQWLVSCREAIFSSPSPPVQRLIEIAQYPPIEDVEFAYGEGLSL